MMNQLLINETFLGEEARIDPKISEQLRSDKQSSRQHLSPVQKEIKLDEYEQAMAA